MKNRSLTITTSLTLLFLLLPCQAEKPEQPIPDLTKGEKLTRINERWVGPVGIHCGVWRPRQGGKFEMENTRQLLVLEVQKGSPADGVLEVNDVILGADGTGAAKVPLFEGSKIWPLVPIANAITEAEARNPAILNLLVWRKGETKTIPIQLEHLGRYSDTAPYDCGKSKAILRKGIKALYEKNEFDESGMGVLCLLAADDPTQPDNDKYQARAKEWVHKLEAGGSPWYVGPKLMAMSEYYMKTKDETIFPKLVALAEYHAKGVSWFGTCGHRYSELAPDGSDNGRIAGYGSITASGTLGYLGLSLARQAGVKSPAVEKSHKAQRTFFGHYAFKSEMYYGEHPYGLGSCTDDYNGKQATSGLAMGMDEGGEKKAKYFSRVAALSSMDVRQYAHGGSFFGQVFHPLGALQAGEKAAHMHFQEIRWHLDLKRHWDYTRIYDASGKKYPNFHKGATALIFYAAPLKQIYLTGRGRKESLKLTDAEFKELQEIKNFDAGKATDDELIAIMSPYEGMLRGAAGDELAVRLKANPQSPEAQALIDRLLAIAADGNAPTFGRVGACHALMQSKFRSQEPMKSMKNAEIARTMAGLLGDPDAYIRFAGVRVLQQLDPASVRPHANAIMDAIVATDRPTFPLDEEDPLQWAHGELGILLYNQVLKQGLDGLDRSKLFPAVRSLLYTPNGAARSFSTKVLAMLDKPDTLGLADLLVDNIRLPPPANTMFAAESAANSQAALAKHLFEEALPLNAVYGMKAAIKNKVFEKYGRSALAIDSADIVLQALGDHILTEAVDARAAAESLVKIEGPKELAKLKSIHGIHAEHETLKLPALQTKLTVDATNHAVREPDGTTYTWRKRYGAGKVDFRPNGSADSKQTTVTFTDKKPGTYCFEVTMSDSLGLNVVRETVVVHLHDAHGKMPRNQPPQVKSQSHNIASGEPFPVTLTGTDPDGDDLGFVVTAGPQHGTLSDPHGQPVNVQSVVDGPVTYTARYGFHGTDSLTFMAWDGQGKTAMGTVEFKVSDQNVGVAVYDGFHYPEGPLHKREGGGSFGFAGPWEGSRGANGSYKVWLTAHEHSKAGLASLGHPSLPASGGRIAGAKHHTASRALDPKVMSDHKLLENGHELWFSVFIEQPQLSFELKGPDVGIGFMAEKRKQKLHATLNGKPAGTTRTGYTKDEHLRFSGTEPQLIVGRCLWGKTDQDADRVEIHRVYDAPHVGLLFLGNPACVLEEPIDQKTLHSIFLNVDGDTAIDEIRIGPTRNSVMVGTKPLR